MLFQGIKKYGEKTALISKETGVVTYKDIEYQVNILKKKFQVNLLQFCYAKTLLRQLFTIYFL
jgi:hypothetical protein